MKKKKKGLLNTIKRIRVKKIEKKPKKASSSDIKIKSKNISNVRVDREKTSRDFIDNPNTSSTTIDIDEREEKDKQIKNNKEEKTIETEEKTNLISFDHKLTEFEYKLKYMNLRDLEGSEYGRYFPPIRKKIIIIDEEDRKFSLIRAGNNQLAGDLYTFFKKNDIKPGEVFRFEYDPDETDENGIHILRLKKK